MNGNKDLETNQENGRTFLSFYTKGYEPPKVQYAVA